MNLLYTDIIFVRIDLKFSKIHFFQLWTSFGKESLYSIGAPYSPKNNSELLNEGSVVESDVGKRHFGDVLNLSENLVAPYRYHFCKDWLETFENPLFFSCGLDLVRNSYGAAYSPKRNSELLNQGSVVGSNVGKWHFGDVSSLSESLVAPYRYHFCKDWPEISEIFFQLWANFGKESLKGLHTLQKAALSFWTRGPLQGLTLEKDTSGMS